MKKLSPTQSLIQAVLSRRGFLGHVSSAMAGIGLTDLLARDLFAENAAQDASSPAWLPGRGRTHFRPKAKRVLQIFCPGAASHMDLWEHKPSLKKYDGKPMPGEENLVSFQGKNGPLMQSPWPFQPAGESGKMISTMLPHITCRRDCVRAFDDLQDQHPRSGLYLHEYGRSHRRFP